MHDRLTWPEQYKKTGCLCCASMLAWPHIRTMPSASVSILVPCEVSCAFCTQCCGERRQYLRSGTYMLSAIFIECTVPLSSLMLNLKVPCPFIAKPPSIPCTDWPVLRIRSSHWSGCVAIVTEVKELMPMRKESVSKRIVGRSLEYPLSD